MLCGWYTARRLVGTYHLHLQDRRVIQGKNQQKRAASWGPQLATCFCCFLGWFLLKCQTLSELLKIITHKTILFIVIAMRTLNPAYWSFRHTSNSDSHSHFYVGLLKFYINYNYFKRKYSYATGHFYSKEMDLILLQTIITYTYFRTSSWKESLKYFCTVVNTGNTVQVLEE
jgi:hypothetical protein